MALVHRIGVFTGSASFSGQCATTAPQRGAGDRRSAARDFELSADVTDCRSGRLLGEISPLRCQTVALAKSCVVVSRTAETNDDVAAKLAAKKVIEGLRCRLKPSFDDGVRKDDLAVT